MATMDEHVDLLGRLYVLAGWLTAFVAVSVACLAAASFSLMLDDWPAQGWAPRVTGVAFTVVALLFGVWGLAHRRAGLGLRGRRSWARPATMGLAVLGLFLVPFGTALSVYAFWVLLHQDVRSRFDRATPAA